MGIDIGATIIKMIPDFKKDLRIIYERLKDSDKSDVIKEIIKGFNNLRFYEKELIKEHESNELTVEDKNNYYENIEKTISIITMLETYRKLYLYNIKEPNYYKEKCIGYINKVKVLKEQLLLCQKELEEVRYRNKDNISVEEYKKLQRELKEKDRIIEDKTNKRLIELLLMEIFLKIV